MPHIYDVLIGGTKAEIVKSVNKKYPVGKRAKVVYTRKKNRVGPGYFWTADVYK